MFIGKAEDISRRAFLRRGSQLAVAGAASSYALGLSGIAEAAAFSAGSDYKALVCVYLSGGNDHNSMLIPFDAANYGRYAAIRGATGEGGSPLVLARASLAATALALPSNQVLTNDVAYALAPTLPRLAELYRAGKMAPLLNVGPLLAPMTRAQFQNLSVPRPPKLFSHNDQASVWQAYSPEGTTIGTGGRIGDMAMSSNYNALFTCISTSGNVVFLAGPRSASYQISNSGAVPINALKSPLFGSNAGSEALRSLLTGGSPHLMAADHALVAKRSIDGEAVVSSALSKAQLATSFTSGTGTDQLAKQLEIVARLIAARNSLGVKRQVFMVNLGGFDTHSGQAANHPKLMQELDFALSAFHAATVEMGIADKVTAFTASDFGRTLALNGDGTDHGWGSHHLVVGGAVKGGRFYGRAPAISLDTDDQVSNGRLIPTTSVDQYMATLARWFGVPASELTTIAPNLGRFASPDLAFMA